MVHPCIKIKAIEGNSLLADSDFNEIRPGLGVEAVLVHPQIEGRIPQTNKSWRYGWKADIYVTHVYLDPRERTRGECTMGYVSGSPKVPIRREPGWCGYRIEFWRTIDNSRTALDKNRRKRARREGLSDLKSQADCSLLHIVTAMGMTWYFHVAFAALSAGRVSVRR